MNRRTAIWLLLAAALLPLLISEDQTIYHHMMKWHTSVLLHEEPFLTWMAKGWIPWVAVVGLMGVGLWLRRQRIRHLGLLGFIALAGSGIIVQLIKHLAGRPRPGLTAEGVTGWGPSMMRGHDSFPSGHASSDFALAAVLSTYYPAGGWFWYALAMILAFLRMWFNAHFASDVIIGAAIGMAVGVWVSHLEWRWIWLIRHVVAGAPAPDNAPTRPTAVLQSWWNRLHCNRAFCDVYLKPRTALWLVVVFGLVSLGPGLVGRDLWNPDEGYSFSIIHHMAVSHDWVVPMLTGEPFMEKPPLYYLSATFFMQWFSPWLPLHDAARLTSGFFVILAFIFTGLAGRELWGKGYGLVTGLILAGCIGLWQQAHKLITDVALFSGFAMAFYGLVLSRLLPVRAGLLIGTGVGVGFLSKGIIAPGMMVMTAVLLPLLFRPWRCRSYLISLLVAGVVALPWLVIWPLALYERSPQLFREWWWVNNIGRFFGGVDVGAVHVPWFYAQTLPWFLWPAWPLALWTLWRKGRDGWRHPEVQLLLVSSVVILGALWLAATARELYLLPLLLPLSLLGAAEIHALPNGVARVARASHGALFGLLAALLWGGWLVMMVTGHPPHLPLLSRALTDDYLPTFHFMPFAAALLCSLFWLAAVSWPWPSALRLLLSWSSGMLLVWGLSMTLWLPWIDDAKSYRSAVLSMKQALPVHYQCIASRDLDEPQRAAFEYLGGIVTERMETHPAAECNLLLLQIRGRVQQVNPGAQWHRIWEGHRPGEMRERFELFERV
jgi:4-amino-4-deoxy-L-arabinose transferase-like glycosyltransferase/membrane-associated phospholipid phosphatase